MNKEINTKFEVKLLMDNGDEIAWGTIRYTQLTDKSTELKIYGYLVIRKAHNFFD